MYAALKIEIDWLIGWLIDRLNSLDVANFIVSFNDNNDDNNNSNNNTFVERHSAIASEALDSVSLQMICTRVVHISKDARPCLSCFLTQKVNSSPSDREDISRKQNHDMIWKW